MLVLPGEEKGTQLVSYPPPPAPPPSCPGQLVSSPRKQLQSQASGENNDLTPFCSQATPTSIPALRAIALSLPGVVTPLGA